MNVPGLVDEMDSSKAGRKAVLGRKERNTFSEHAFQVSLGQQGHNPEDNLVFSRKLSLMVGKTENTPFLSAEVSSVPLALTPQPL